MKFTPTPLAGLVVVELELLVDERGSFARSWCSREFAAHGLETRVVQCNVSMNRAAGTLRGMHYQRAPHAEAKLVRCSRGAAYDVAIDLRPGSATYLQHFGTEISAANQRALFIPPGFAHGFLTLADETEILYQMSEFYEPAAAGGVRWNDPAFKIEWPHPVAVISPRDRDYPDFDRASAASLQ